MRDRQCLANFIKLTPCPSSKAVLGFTEWINMPPDSLIWNVRPVTVSCALMHMGKADGLYWAAAERGVYDGAFCAVPQQPPFGKKRDDRITYRYSAEVCKPPCRTRSGGRLLNKRSYVCS